MKSTLSKLIVILFFVVCLFSSPILASDVQDSYVITVVGDPHLPGNNINAKRKLISTLNSWVNTDLVVVMGDVCKSTGTEAEYKFVKQYFSHLKKPFEVVCGNHDYIFSKADGGWDTELASAEERSMKLNRFMQTFDMQKLYSSKIIGNYNLVFLSLDSLDTEYYAEISKKQIQWFDWQLNQHKDKATIVFCHAPLWWDVLTQINPAIMDFTIQPMKEVKEILDRHKQVFMWVAGHVHMGANNKFSKGFLNTYKHRIVNINNCDIDGHSVLKGVKMQLIDHPNLWTKNLELHPKKVVVKTYDHNTKKVIQTREVKIPCTLQ